MASPIVYFAGAPGRIKIGHTTDIGQRMRTLNIASSEPLELLAAIRAPRRTETALHALLSQHRIGGEWFHDCDDVRAAMRRFEAGSFEAVENLNATRPFDENVAWAGGALREIVAPRRPDETTKDMIGRAAERIGSTYWRTFSLWYRKAHRLEINERQAIESALRIVQ